MRVIRGLHNIRKLAKGSVLTIGVFDGVHRGHRAIIRKVTERASRSGLNSVVVTFDPHPLKVLRPGSNVPSLISLEHRIKLIKEFGVDILVILNFTKAFSRMRPERFIKDILIKSMTPELYATHVAYQLVKSGMPFRKAYRKIEDGIEDISPFDPHEIIKMSKHIGGTANLQSKVMKKELSGYKKDLLRETKNYNKIIFNFTNKK